LADAKAADEAYDDVLYQCSYFFQRRNTGLQEMDISEYLKVIFFIYSFN